MAHRPSVASSRKRAPTRLAAEVSADVRTFVPTGELGVDGVGLFGGDLQTENNTKLLHTEAYGTPGSRSWGEWEKLLRTNPFIALGMDFVGGHIRDARVGVEAAKDVADGQRHADFCSGPHRGDGPASPGESADGGGLTPGFALHESSSSITSPLLPGGSASHHAPGGAPAVDGGAQRVAPGRGRSRLRAPAGAGR